MSIQWVLYRYLLVPMNRVQGRGMVNSCYFDRCFVLYGVREIVLD